VLGLLLSCALIAGACGSGDDGDQASTEDGAATTEGGDDEGVPTSDDREGNDQAVDGGKLVYGLEADSANPWVHYATSCAISCREIFRAISDPLFVPTQEEGGDATIEPFLLESAEPSADYMTWTFTARDGITFHDGTPFDGEAIRYNLDVCRFSSLTGPAFAHLDTVTASGQTATITLKMPDVALPYLLRDEVCGMMFSPTWMRTLESNPLRKLDPSRVDPPTGNQAAPVGLGAFKYQSYSPGNGNSFVAVKYDDYWRADEGLPHLDEVEFVVAVDIQSRSNGLRSGQFNVIHTANSDESHALEDDGDFFLMRTGAFGETAHVMFNVAEGTNPAYAALSGKDGAMDPTGVNASSPLLNLHCRRALVHAIDLERFVDEREAGLTEPSNGPFAPGSLGYLEDSGYPKYDPALAEEEMTTCLEELGTDKIAFEFNTTNDPFNVESNQLTIAMWQEVFGDRVDTSVTPVEQGQYIGLALVGDFNAFAWRNFGSIDPNELFYWWVPATASPIGTLALNFGRFIDQEIADSLVAVRTSPDIEDRKAAAQAINSRFGEQAYNLWYYWVAWTIAANPAVRNLTDLPLPAGADGGGPIIPIIGGKHHLAQVWCEGGNCEG
jgi:peptide/nickel transport system substrate-binding protein